MKNVIGGPQHVLPAYEADHRCLSHPSWDDAWHTIPSSQESLPEHLICFTFLHHFSLILKWQKHISLCCGCPQFIVLSTQNSVGFKHVGGNQLYRRVEGLTNRNKNKMGSAVRLPLLGDNTNSFKPYAYAFDLRLASSLQCIFNSVWIMFSFKVSEKK